MRKVYLDYAATTPVDPEVLRVMRPYFGKIFGNTMSIHQWGQEANSAVEKARGVVAKSIKAKSEEIILTGSATESNNLALKGLAFKRKSGHIIVSAIEHDCVLGAAKWLQGRGFEVDYVGVDKEGRVRLEDVKKLIKNNTFLVSVMWANNEIGTIQDIEGIGNICHKRGIVFHTDAAQAWGKEKIDVEAAKVDMLTASSHKIYGPKGAAFLYVKRGVEIEPLFAGGGQERGLRSSTVNVPAIVGMAKAIEIYKDDTRVLKERLIDGLLKIKEARLNGSRKLSLANIANVTFAGVEGESLVLALADRGIGVSTGSACSSASLEPSHVLMAMGLGAKAAHGSIRFSLGRWTTKEDVDYVIKAVKLEVKRFKKISVF